MVNHLASLPSLRNRYFALRHGESLANRAGIIISDPQVGVPEYGLTETGRQQVYRSLQQQPGPDHRTQIYSSDFRRARETAMIVQEVLATTRPMAYSPALRERYFGAWEHTATAHYARVWAEDQRNPWHDTNAVESAAAVLDRTTALVLTLEQTFQDQTILLVAHGDVLQILQTGFHKLSPACHRHLPHLQPAELRELRFMSRSVL
jgi:probable phosphoglycerate mutase